MKFIVVAAARPNFMKVAPILAAFEQQKKNARGLEVRLVHTGQHYDRKMSDDFFTDLNIPEPDLNLEVGSGSHAEQTGRVMIAFEKVCLAERPDCVIVVGDVNSTMACAITAKKLQIGVAHVEAGLRSGDMSMPEEINRLCTDAISDYLFTTDEFANENLRREGCAEAKIRFAGNTMIDTLMRHIDRARRGPLPEGLSDGEYAVLTLHRPGNVDNRQTLCGIFTALQSVAERLPVVFPAHPRTKKNMADFGLLDPLLAAGRIRLIEPLSYLPFIGLVARSRMVLTDSGGIQEETTVLGVPCVTMRPNTERPITCSMGTNILAGSDPARIREAAHSALDGGSASGAIPPLWDGHAGERIVSSLLCAHDCQN